MQIARIALTAAEWWKQQLNSDNNDAGDPLVNISVKDRAEDAPIITSKQAKCFKRYLARAIIEQRPYYIGVDYGPNEMLSAALLAAGVEENEFRGYGGILPVKTRMFIDNGKVEAKSGYGADMDVIYTFDQSAYEPS